MAEPRLRRRRPRAAALAQPPDVDVAVRCRRWLARLPRARALCRRAVRAAFAAAPARARAGQAPAEASVVLADDAFVRALNRRFRSQDRATDVLSFRASDGRAPAPCLLLGDVVVALETAARDARREGKRLGDHLSHLVVHGLLHLLGYDHAKASEARVMEALEVEALARLGVGDPYRGGPSVPAPAKGRRR